MNVLYITLGGKGGSDKALIDLLSILHTKYNIVPLVICGRKEILPDLQRLGIRVLYYDFEWALCPPTLSLKDKILYIPRRLKAILRRRWDVKVVLKRLGDFKPEIIHTNVGVVNLGYKLSKKTGIPNVWHIREYQILDHNMHYIGGKRNFVKSLRDNQFNIGITKDIYHYFEMVKPAIQIYDGVRCAHSNVSPKKKGEYFIFAGFLYLGKGLDELLYAYKQYSDMGGKNELLILGTWDPNNAFHKWVAQYIKINMLHGVKLLGFRNDVDELMSSSAAVIVPSRFEAFGRVTCEAMFNKTLVIGKDTGGTKEQFDNLDEYIGKRVALRYLTVDELVKRMFEVECINIELRSMIIEKSFELVNMLYSNELSSAKVYEYYKTVLGK